MWYKTIKKMFFEKILYFLTIISEPSGGCDDSMCAFGGLCIPRGEGETGPARCHCEDTCPYVYDPV